MMKRLLALGGVFFAILIPGKSVFAKSCSLSELTVSVSQVAPLLKKPHEKLTQADMDLLQSKVIPLNKASQIKCIKKDVKLFLEALKLAGTVCLLDDYRANLEFVLELEKEKLFSSHLKEIDAHFGACIQLYLQSKKDEKSLGND